MVLGRGFESQLNPQTRWKMMDQDGRKTNENNKDIQMGQVTQKKLF